MFSKPHQHTGIDLDAIGLAVRLEQVIYKFRDPNYTYEQI
jgi:hypothetical protein